MKTKEQLKHYAAAACYLPFLCFGGILALVGYLFLEGGRWLADTIEPPKEE